VTPDQAQQINKQIDVAKHLFVYTFKRLSVMPIETIFEAGFFDDGHYWPDGNIPYHNTRSRP
jgi:hypothetical protein